MPDLTVILKPLTDINLAPASLLEEVVQNVRVILSTVKGTVPLDRAFGLAADLLDEPLPVAQALLSADIVEAINQYEPRVKVVKVDFADDQDVAADGILRPSVRIRIKDGVRL